MFLSYFTIISLPIYSYNGEDIIPKQHVPRNTSVFDVVHGNLFCTRRFEGWRYVVCLRIFTLIYSIQGRGMSAL